ncbi:PAS domain-containing protein [Sneathiella litorea]|uniref:PAS domain-containing protein n=1 Tax=Sneathiella litorea TaxID=2606216 RepID=A0A6L8W609_9PROT|nr:PAS domain-containing protein [Sneathiella litorea]MZR30575.1 PAS domain-containing protein [Sneathiella litorea]
MAKFTTSLEKISNPALRDLVKYWLRLTSLSIVPHRHQFNPVDIPHCLRNIILVDVEAGTPKYFIRLAGSAINPVYHRSITGCYLENVLSDENRADIIAQYDHTVTYQIPTFMFGEIATSNGRSQHYERVVLPMTTDSETVDKLLVGLNFFNVKASLIDRPIFKL